MAFVRVPHDQGGEGHDWVEVTTVDDILEGRREWRCPCCPAEKTQRVAFASVAAIRESESEEPS